MSSSTSASVSISSKLKSSIFISSISVSLEDCELVEMMVVSLVSDDVDFGHDCVCIHGTGHCSDDTSIVKASSHAELSFESFVSCMSCVSFESVPVSDETDQESRSCFCWLSDWLDHLAHSDVSIHDMLLDAGVVAPYHD